jgi:lysophospholipase L1-like esterase
MIGAGLLAACGSWAVLELLGGREAGASAAANSATRVSVVGDSLTLGTLPYQPEAFSAADWAGSTIDAHGSRGIRTKLQSDHHTGLTAVDAIRATSGDSNLWVVALGTNDAGIYANDKHAAVIRQMMDRIGSGHSVMWVNVYLPDTLPRQQAWNSALATVAAERPGEMFVYDWASLIARNEIWMAHDHIHCSSTGYRQRSIAIAQASRNLVTATAAGTRRRSQSFKALAA